MLGWEVKGCNGKDPVSAPKAGLGRRGSNLMMSNLLQGCWTWLGRERPRGGRGPASWDEREVLGLCLGTGKIFSSPELVSVTIVWEIKRDLVLRNDLECLSRKYLMRIWAQGAFK